MAKKEQQNLKRELEYFSKAMEKRRKELQNLKGEISQARINNDFLKREIGDEGINIDTRVQNAFERET
ncbi:hypothetical protein HpCK14_04010 [Helicobacter pylori]